MAICAISLLACSDDSNSWSAKDVCPIDGVNAYGMPNRGTFTDERDGQVYKYTTIGDQVWMAENLNYNSEYSVCYDNDESNCDFWGRLYSLREGGDKSNPLDFAMLDSLCPAGWHVPNIHEWYRLIVSVGNRNSREAAKRLKSTELWVNEYSDSDYNGTDECGFRVLPAGYQRVVVHDSIENVGMYTDAKFLSSTMESPKIQYAMNFDVEMRESYSACKASIRCIKN